MAKSKTNKSPAESATFEQSLEALGEIVEQLESGELGLSDALARYEEGIKHLKACYQILEKAERKIELLSGVDAEGNPVTEPLDDDAAESLEEKGAARSKRRSKPHGRTAGAKDAMDDASRLF